MPAYEYRVVHDESPDNNPRDCDNISMLALFHNRFTLENDSGLRTEDYEGWHELKAALEESGATHVHMVWMYDHSGVSLKASSAGNPFLDWGGWDSGIVGFAYTTKERLDCFGGEDGMNDVDGAIASEVEEYGRYLNGEVYVAQIVDCETNQVVDSIGGIIGYEWAEAEGQALLLGWPETTFGTNTLDYSI